MRKRNERLGPLTLVLTLCALILVPGCGDDSPNTGPTQEDVSITPDAFFPTDWILPPLDDAAGDVEPGDDVPQGDVMPEPDALRQDMPGRTDLPPRPDIEPEECDDDDGDGFGKGGTILVLCSGSTTEPDCDDTRPDIYPGAGEVECNGIDEDCSGADSCGTPACQDNDSDGYGRAGTDISGCPASTTEADCNDSDRNIHPGAAEVECDGKDNDCQDGDDCPGATCSDNDGDGYGQEGTDLSGCTGKDGTTYPDCNDSDPAIHPYGDEVPCDGIDNDCYSGDQCGNPECTDYDGDGYGQPGTALGGCPGQDATLYPDCDDSNPNVHPYGTEVECDGIDNDCYGGDSCGSPLCTDYDGDGYGQPGTALGGCPGQDATLYPDCDDGNPAIHPYATEVECDGIDNDCFAGDSCGVPDCVDYDGDGYGQPGTALGSCPGLEANQHPDCDDSNPAVHPYADEVPCDGVDNDCYNGDYCGAACMDNDGDGYGAPGTDISGCTSAIDSTLYSDCDDANPAVHPYATEVECDDIDNDCYGGDLCGSAICTDYDGDGYGAPGTDLSGCTEAQDATLHADCDEGNADVHPYATEVECDGIDNDCFLGDACGEPCADADGDGYGAPETNLAACWGQDATLYADCDDTDPAVHPYALEIPCDDIDNDCFMGDYCGDECTDGDGDGYGAANTNLEGCVSVPDGTLYADCDDANPAVHPYAVEVECDGLDNDCFMGDECPTRCQDNDRDGYGAPNSDLSGCNTVPDGTLLADCDDANPSVHPWAAEIPCDGLDNDCFAGDLCQPGCEDGDGDGYGAPGTDLSACSMVAGGTLYADCDDANPAIHPYAIEVRCDGLDNDCYMGDECPDPCEDGDGDGYGAPATNLAGCNTVPDGTFLSDCDDANPEVHPWATEVLCDDIDNDCFGGDLCDVPECQDSDGDGYGDGGSDLRGCTAHRAWEYADCDDDNPDVHPFALEIPCDGLDNDCFLGDECEIIECQDVDGDGYGRSGTDLSSCTGLDGDLFSDCDDSNPDVHPYAAEIQCDGLDNDCFMGDDCPGQVCQDGDGDGYGVEGTDLSNCPGYDAWLYSDCNDNDPAIHPYNWEIECDGIDNDCYMGDYCPGQPCMDDDGDGYGAPGSDLSQCWGEGATLEADCNDSDPTINPYAPEIECDGVDNDCSQGDFCPMECIDDDGDGYGAEGSDLVDCPGFNAWLYADCNDSDPDIHPYAMEEECDGVDNDCFMGDYCPGQPCMDDDGDGYGAEGTDLTECTGLDAWLYDDCDDTDPTIHPYAEEVRCDGIDNDCYNGDNCPDTCVDGDGDGYGAIGTDLSQCPGFNAWLYGDCNDKDPDIHPYAAELLCDGIDNDCFQGDDCPLDCVDLDGDGYGVEGTDLSLCSGEYAWLYFDCNDDDPHIHPYGLEVECDGIDNDCYMGDYCPGNPCVDEDGDGYGAANTDLSECLGENADIYPDCDDTDPDVHPYGVEIECDGIDNDCYNGDDCPITCQDSDGDGYGAQGTDTWLCPGYNAWLYEDCDDNNADVHPYAEEISCDGIDNDCYEGDWCVIAECWDTDGDGYGAEGTDLSSCWALDAHVLWDCNDGDPTIHPYALEESCNGIDEDCDGGDQCNCLDADGDGYGACGTDVNDCPAFEANLWCDCDDGAGTVHPYAMEVECDGIDNDCFMGDDCFGAPCEDNDGDGYGAPNTDLSLCHGRDATLYSDCDDNDPHVHPYAEEISCDGVDNDCYNGDQCRAILCKDSDGDGYGATGTNLGPCTGYDADLYPDCDDDDPHVHPYAEEISCDGVDNDCFMGDACSSAPCWDDDGDGYGLEGTDLTLCLGLDGDIYPDCDDDDPEVHPYAFDIPCDGVDNDCSLGDDCTVVPCEDEDGDGYGVEGSDLSECTGFDGHLYPDCDDDDPEVHPYADEIWCDGVDNDCYMGDDCW